MKRYMCPRELLPVIEAALAADGYVIAESLPFAASGSWVTVMARDGAVVVLHDHLACDTAEISVCPDDAAGGLSILEALPRLIATPPGKHSAR